MFSPLTQWNEFEKRSSNYYIRRDTNELVIFTVIGVPAHVLMRGAPDILTKNKKCTCAWVHKLSQYQNDEAQQCNRKAIKTSNVFILMTYWKLEIRPHFRRGRSKLLPLPSRVLIQHLYYISYTFTALVCSYRPPLRSRDVNSDLQPILKAVWSQFRFSTCCLQMNKSNAA